MLGDCLHHSSIQTKKKEPRRQMASGKLLAMEAASDELKGKLLQVEARLSALEAGKDAPWHGEGASRNETAIAVSCGMAAAYCAYRGLGIPNHPYQLAIAAGLTLMGYHSAVFAKPRTALHWALVVINPALLTMLSKLLIGGGIRRPFFWAQVPSLQFDGWPSMIPKANVLWQNTDLASWTIDLTTVQSFFALLCAFATLVKFQPFASLCGFFLILISIPAFADFSWPWVFPALMLSGFTFYLQIFRQPTAA